MTRSQVPAVITTPVSITTTIIEVNSTDSPNVFFTDIPVLCFRMNKCYRSVCLIQSEFDTLNTTLTQLTNQKNVAQKRLDELDGQVVAQHAQ